MHTTSILRRSLILFICSLSLLLTFPQPAAADFFDDTVWVLEQTKVFPSDQIQAFKDSRQLVECLVSADNDLQVIACIDSFKNTPAGKDLIQQGGIPSWFWDLVELYVDIRTGDFWGAVGHLGKAAICFIAQVITSGTVDVCGAIQELIAIGEALLDAATAVVEFLADIGEAAIDTVRGVGCSLGLGGCDDSPPPPPQVLAYQWIYGPKILEGVQALKQVDAGAYPAFKSQLRVNALHRPYAIYSVPVQTVTMMGTKVELPPPMAFYEPAVNIAEELFTKTTDANWTTDIVQNTLPDLSVKRSSYTTTSKLQALAYSALMKYQTELNGPNAAYTQDNIDLLVTKFVKESCQSEFNQTWGFAHFDRWLLSHSKEAYDLSRPDSTPLWCSKLISGYAKDFAPKFRQYLQQHGCTVAGEKLYCNSLNAFRSCRKLMGTVAGAEECMANTAAVGPEAAQLIRQKMVDRGSNQQLYHCSVNGPQTANSIVPARLTCSRPVQQHSCTSINQELFGQLPQTLVTCQLQESGSYAQLRQAVTQARQQLFAKHPAVAYKSDDVDPLIAYVDSSQSIATLQEDSLNQSFTFPPPSTQPGFSYKIAFSPSGSAVDGTDTPQIVHKLDKPDPKDGLAQQSPRDRIIGYHDPRINPDPTQNLQQGMLINPAAELKTAPHTQFRAPVNQQLPGMQGQVQGQQQVMSGSLPPGSQPPAGNMQQPQRLAPRPQVRQIPPAVADKPDLVTSTAVSVAGITGQWGGSLVLSAQQLQPAGNNLCAAAVTYTVQNAGPAASPPFSSLLTNSAVSGQPQPQQWAALAPRASLVRIETVLLKTGQNILTLQLDQNNQLDELNRANNQTRLLVILNGICSQPLQQPPAPQAPTPQRQQPSHPTRLPGFVR